MISKDTHSIEYVNSLREKYKKIPLFWNASCLLSDCSKRLPALACPLHLRAAPH